MTEIKYNSPEDVIPITSYATFLKNAELWTKARNLHKAEFDRVELAYNVSTEILEGAQAMTTFVNLIKREGTIEQIAEEMYAYLDSIADALIFVAVDSFKRGFPTDNTVEIDKTRISLPNPEAVLNPMMSTWFFEDNVNLYFLLTCQQIVQLEYSPFCIFTEVFKEISTRRGKYDKEIGKWVKEPTDPLTSYKADFSKCGLNLSTLENQQIHAYATGFDIK